MRDSVTVVKQPRIRVCCVPNACAEGFLNFPEGDLQRFLIATLLIERNIKEEKKP
jgi:hypothetical protein